MLTKKAVGRIGLEDGIIVISVKGVGPHFNEVLNDIKANIPARNWNGNGKFWTAPRSSAEMVAQFAERWNIPLDPQLNRLIGASEKEQKAMHEEYERKVRLTWDKYSEMNIYAPLKGQLRSYQKAGALFMTDKVNALNGDEMGLGKTIQAIAAMSETKDYPWLIIAPKTLLENWAREIKKWTELKARIVTAQDKNALRYLIQYKAAHVIITNYDTCRKLFVEKMEETNRGYSITLHQYVSEFKGIIIDESHMIKNSSAIRTKIILKMSHVIPRKFSLTGTPVLRDGKDIITQLQFLGKESTYGGYRAIEAMTQTEKARKELGLRMREDFYIRREKKDVAKELPDKIRQIIPVEITNAPEYDLAMNDLSTFMLTVEGKSHDQIDRSMRAEALVKIQTLKRVAARGKIEPAIEFINDVLDNGEKLVVFCYTKENLAAVHKAFPHARLITGDVPIDQRNQNVLDFQENPNCKLMLCTIQAGGVGITLTASSKVLFLEFGWNPGEHDQAEDRCHRIGAKDTVFAYYMVGMDTIDNEILNMIADKRAIVEDITGQSSDNLQGPDNNVLALLERLKAKKDAK